ncbi:MAG: LON peptidase substrate-binding domain-containing protein [Gemmatimonadaceae bacterium]
MSDSTAGLPGTVPLFPLPLVLFPDGRLPLHIFEPRYRQMLGDIMAGNRTFGLIGSDSGAAAPRPGAIGCLAVVESATRLPDGRSNIVVRGTQRFEVLTISSEGTPYLTAAIAPVSDDPQTNALLGDAAAELRALVQRVSQAARAIAEQPIGDLELPDDPHQLSFAVAQAIDLELSVKQSLLASRDPLARLRHLRELLGRILAPLEARAAAHDRARSNGHGPPA